MIDKLRYKEHLDRIDQLRIIKKQSLLLKNVSNLNHVVYVMETVKVCGGVKIILQHAQHLIAQGIKVTLVAHFPAPTWFPLKAEYIQVPFGIELANGIPQCDLIIANYYKHINSCIETGLAPVVYFEQGDFHLFNFNELEPQTRAFVFRQYQLPEFILTVSNKAAEFIKKNFGREAEVIHIAIDQTIFNTSSLPYESNKPYVLMMGLENTFKCIEDVISAIKILRNKQLDIDLIWITPEAPISNSFNHQHINKIFVNPSQLQISSLYRGASVFVSASQYESFSLPVLEAMSCECPVVTTNNAGVLEYAESHINTLISKMNNPIDLSENIEEVIFNPELAKKLKINGLVTANQFSWNNVIKDLIQYYKSCSSYMTINKSTIDEWDIEINKDELINPNEYEKLKKLILNSQADIIKVPCLYDLIEGHRIARWEVIAKKKNSDLISIENLLIYVKAKKEVPVLYETAYQSYKINDFLNAFNLFSMHFKNEDNILGRSIYAKWMILCLIGMKDYSKALKLIHDFIEVYEDFTDLYYLLNYLHYIKNQNTKDEYDQLISTIGVATGYPEYLYGI